MGHSLIWLIADYHDLRTRFVLRYRSTNGWVASFGTSGQASVPQGKRLRGDTITLIRDEPIIWRQQTKAKIRSLSISH